MSIWLEMKIKKLHFVAYLSTAMSFTKFLATRTQYVGYVTLSTGSIPNPSDPYRESA
jgi:hypothetical protein